MNKIKISNAARKINIRPQKSKIFEKIENINMYHAKINKLTNIIQLYLDKLLIFVPNSICCLEKEVIMRVSSTSEISTEKKSMTHQAKSQANEIKRTHQTKVLILKYSIIKNGCWKINFLSFKVE